jgi:nitrite reductase/ring-hydroxylating ferredoxin subunit
MARRNLAHVKADTIDQSAEVVRVPAAHYTDPARFALEIDRLWKRVPLVLALSCELPRPGDYRTLEVAGVPVLIARGADGGVRAFLNSCAHRGAQVVTQEAGHARRFVCPYHAWTYDLDGSLVGIQSQREFGKLDRACHGLVRLPTAERAGLVFAVLDPASKLEIDASSTDPPSRVARSRRRSAPADEPLRARQRMYRMQVRTSSTNVSGCSNAAKWPPFGSVLKCTRFGKRASHQRRELRKISFGKMLQPTFTETASKGGELKLSQ